MKLNARPFAFSAAIVVSTAALMGGCATTGMDRSVKTTNSIQDVDTEIRKLIVQIDATGSSLDSLVLAREPELKKSFDAYSDDVVKLDREGKKTMKRMDEMKSNSKEYFAEWEKQGDGFSNPQIRELSEERRTKLAGIYGQVPASGTGVKGAYAAYLTDLKEIQKFLSTDLTPTGLQMITPVAQKTVRDRESLKASFVPVLSALDDIKAELYSGKK